MRPPTFEDVRVAHRRIAPWIHRTPVLTCATFDRMSGATLFFKCENFQKTGAFKARGATNAVLSLSDAEAERGVATHSSGNHGMALAHAADARGIRCTVVMPETAAQAKIDAVRGYGGEIVFCAPTNRAREQTLAQIIERTGADFVAPFNDRRVIAGQGTCAVELVEDVDALEAIVAPIGGGGLISGTALAAAAIAPETRIYAAEPEQADDAWRSLRAGELIVEDAPQTIADGLKASLAPLTWHFVSRHLSDVLLASEAEIVEAMRLTWQRMKIVIEPSCALPLATILKNPQIFAYQRVGVILTGGNVDLARLPWIEKA